MTGSWRMKQNSSGCGHDGLGSAAMTTPGNGQKACPSTRSVHSSGTQKGECLRKSSIHFLHIFARRPDRKTPSARPSRPLSIRNHPSFSPFQPPATWTRPRTMVSGSEWGHFLYHACPHRLMSVPWWPLAVIIGQKCPRPKEGRVVGGHISLMGRPRVFLRGLPPCTCFIFTVPGLLPLGVIDKRHQYSPSPSSLIRMRMV